MVRYFIAWWYQDLTDVKKKPIPVGCVVREGDIVEVRSVGPERWPVDYQPKGELSKAMLSGIDDILRRVEEPDSYPTSLYVTELKFDAAGTLGERVERLFKEKVMPSFAWTC